MTDRRLATARVRQADMGDQFARLKRAVEVRAFARQAVERRSPVLSLATF